MVTEKAEHEEDAFHAGLAGGVRQPVGLERLRCAPRFVVRRHQPAASGPTRAVDAFSLLLHSDQLLSSDAVGFAWGSGPQSLRVPKRRRSPAFTPPVPGMCDSLGRIGVRARRLRPGFRGVQRRHAPRRRL